MLGAFFGPRYCDWWLSYARNPESTSYYCNHWLVRTSAAKIYARGLYHVNPVFIGPEDPVEVDGPYALLGDHSRTGIQKVDPRFVGTHARLCKSIRYVEIAREIAPEILPPSPSSPSRRAAPCPSQPTSGRKASSPSSVLPTGVFLSVWLMFPNRLRIAAYDVLRDIGERLYGKPNGYSTVQRLPFGLYLKYQGEPAGFRNEFNALRIVGQHTSIPVPKPLDVVVKESKSDGPFSSQAYLLITRLPGVPLSRYQDVLSDSDCEHIAAQLKDYLAQLRNIPRPTSFDPEAVICDTLGAACRDPRIRSGDPVGPFPDEAAFSEVLCFPDDPARRGHKIVFTHADLNPRNILMTARPMGMLEEGVFAGLGDYSKELDVETRSWESGDGI
ncbi:hypothetical protein GY45DRAFT_1352463 [Cubamyces sp. BRFM 1775]|nr:hypothetical protein GY45DRAFT_1352463 [Cubamyces sp. BRFM 1775]